jgi:dihydroorotate dehydrogenase electron transfer subunit
MIQMISTVISNERLTDVSWKISLACPAIAAAIQPGQFVMIKIGKAHDPLLRRPFSVFRAVQSGKGPAAIEIVYKVIGRGTRQMTLLKAGDELDVIGPLGHGFELDPAKRVHVLLGGGTGGACLFLLAERISRSANASGVELNVLLGAPTRDQVLLEKEFSSLCGNVLVSTDDGSYGHRGLITDMLQQAFDSGRISRECAIYASGPEPMLKALAPICRAHRIPAQVSIERHMMCGLGACLVCVCRVNKEAALKRRNIESSHLQFLPEEEFGYGLTCKDGPVFYLEEIAFDD